MKSLNQLMDLKGRVALITGGAGHIGGAFADSLAEMGASIAVLDMAEDASADAARRIHDEHQVETLPLPVDLANEAEVVAAANSAINHFGRLDILVNCAAFVGTTQLPGWSGPFVEQSPETWRACLEVNLTAPFVLTQACTSALKESGHGSVINIGSIRNLTGVDPNIYEGSGVRLPPSAYSASKAGLMQMTSYLASVLAPHVRVNSISFGGIERNQPEPFHTRYIERTPLARMGTEEDAKGAIAYLASDLSAYVTGHNLIVDGGWTTW
jgi:NAD(P)-dependent dehydrogenase (short-subunit alcohol dehydrogenase family)